MKKWLAVILAALTLAPLLAFAQEPLPQRVYDYNKRVVRKYDSDSLKYTVETMKLYGVKCYLVKVWVRDPARQIRKVTAEWKTNIMRPVHMAQKLPELALAINGSGYVSPVYPWIPENYPGTNSDYYYTPLGSLTITDGEIFRNLEGVPYYGLTLEEDGLQMYTGADNADVLARNPSQTWSFYVECPMQRNGEILTPDPEDWEFAGKRARRTVLGRMDRNNYLILSVTNEGGFGLTLPQVNTFFKNHFPVEWLYNLDGGPSSALLCRGKGKNHFATVAGGEARDADILGFTELPEE